MEFVSLHNQTDFSILDSICSVKGLFNRAKELGQQAIAITEHGSFASAWDAWKVSKATGIKLIIGCELYFRNNVKDEDEKMSHILLLAKNEVGYKNILTLNKLGFDFDSRVGKRVYPVIDWTLLEKYSEGVICLTACGNGIISQLVMRREFAAAEEAALRLKKIFGDNLGLEVQPNNMVRNSNTYNDDIDQKFINHRLIKLGEKLGIRVVAACNTHYLRKEDHETHDVFLAIGARQPVFSSFRLRYPVPDFYLKSGQEVKDFFSRSYGESLAEQLCLNSLYFASLCETPEWIDPKYSNPSGKELPIFPVKDEPDYEEFKAWVFKQEGKILSLDEDKQYLRYCCEKLLNSKFINSFNINEYKSRLNEELDVLEYQGFSSYMLIVADLLKWCRNNNIPIGPGRGCVSGDTLVLTNEGYKKITNINIGDFIYTNDGSLRKVCKTFVYDINEECLSLDTQFGYKQTILTKDHKVYGTKFDFFNSKNNSLRRKWNTSKLEWFPADALTKHHLLWMPWIKNTPSNEWNSELDLVNFINNHVVHNDYIECKFYAKNEFSISEVANKCGLNKWIVYKIKHGKNTAHKEYNISLIKDYLSNIDLDYNEWLNKDYASYYEIRRKIKLDEEFYYFIGLWIGDGFLVDKSNKKCVGISFHKKEISNALKIQKYLSKYGFVANIYHKKNEKAIQLEVNNGILFNLIKFIVNGYKNSSDTKCLPFYFRKLNSANLYSLINGLFDADGNSRKNHQVITTTSFRLALEVKESLLYLKHISSIYEPIVKGNRKQSYVINFSKFFNGKVNQNKHFYKEDGCYFRIKSVKYVKVNKVYDLEIEGNHNYITTNLVSHNSVGGSLVAYLLDIHKADPIKYGLIFARFQNKERDEAPDIDNDISGKYRPKLIEYIKNKYGEDNVASISNINTITPKVYARDIARSCELGGSREEAVNIGNLVADIIPSDIKSIDSALEKVPLLSEYVKKYPEIEKYKDIGSKYRAFSTHAAGIIINSRPLVGLVPLRKDKDNNTVIEYDKINTEQNSFIKIDLLGLSTLDLIEDTIKLINDKGIKLSIDDINVDEYDKKTYDLISSGKTYGVFQFGTSGGTIDLCMKVKPKSIEDLAIITTLARPGASDIRNDFILTRDGKKEYKLLHPLLKNSFEKTLGFGLFDESILQIAKDVAKWSLHSADRIRKMIKSKGKYPEVDKKLREEFIEGAINNNVDKKMAEKIWDEEIKKFSSYTFNKSHAVLYSMISFITAYLKAHYPIEFLQANLMHEVNSNTKDASSNIDKIKKELRELNIDIVPPDINKSDLTYKLVEGNKLITGLDALKFVGDEAIKDIVSKRPFNSFFDFMVRVDSRKVRANNIQALAACGAFDNFGISRKLLFLYCSDYRKKLQVWKKKHDPNVEEFNYPWPNDGEWSESEIYALETYYLGEGFVCKPYKAYGPFFEGEHHNVSHVKRSKDRDTIPYFKGIVVDYFEFKVKKETSRYYGQAMAKVTIEDKYGEQISCTVFPDRWKMVHERLKQVKRSLEFTPGVALYFRANVNYYNDEVGLILDQLYNAYPPPSVPSDLKAKKVVLKRTKPKTTAKKFEKPKNANAISQLLNRINEEIEDNLYDEGLIDLDDETEGL